MSQKLNLILPTTVFKPAPYGGVRSSIDFNNFMDQVITDIYSLVDQFNKRIVPILNGLPLAEYQENLNAVIGGLTSAYMYVSKDVTSGDTYSDYYLQTNIDPSRPSTVKEVFDQIIGKVQSLESITDGISQAIEAIQYPTLDLEAIQNELQDVRNSIIEIITVLRNLKFYTDVERIHALTVLADPDYEKAAVQTLVNLGPAVKFSTSVTQNLFVNFTVPATIDVSQPIVPNFAYTMDTSYSGLIRIEMEVQIVRAGMDLQSAPTSVYTVELTPNATQWYVSTYRGTGLSFNVSSEYDLVNLRLSNLTGFQGSHSGNFYLLDLSFFGKRLPVQLVTI